MIDPRLSSLPTVTYRAHFPMAEDKFPEIDDPIVLPPADSLDLHHFQPRDIASVTEEYLHQCQLAGFREVRLIHGKGVGVQRKIVQSVLGKHPAVASFRDAPWEAGSWGATLVVLRKPD